MWRTSGCNPVKSKHSVHRRSSSGAIARQAVTLYDPGTRYTQDSFILPRGGAGVNGDWRKLKNFLEISVISFHLLVFKSREERDRDRVEEIFKILKFFLSFSHSGLFIPIETNSLPSTPRRNFI